MANHLEDLISQYFEWKGCIVRRNVKVGPLAHGGWAGEVDVMAYDYNTNTVWHFEPSTDGNKWEKREAKYQRKFEAGRKYVKHVFPWLKGEVPIKQIALFSRVPENRRAFQGGYAVSIDGLVGAICKDIVACGRAREKAIPEQYDLLRMAQLIICGYNKPWNKDESYAILPGTERSKQIRANK